MDSQNLKTTKEGSSILTKDMTKEELTQLIRSIEKDSVKTCNLIIKSSTILLLFICLESNIMNFDISVQAKAIIWYVREKHNIVDYKYNIN